MKSKVSTKGLDAIRNNGKQFIKQQAQSRGITKAQLNANRGRVKDLLKNKAKDTLVPKANDIFQNHGKAFTKKHFEQFGNKKALQLKNIAIGKLKNHGINYQHKLRHLHERNHIIKLDWCKQRPRVCHWWYDACKPIRYYEPQHCISLRLDLCHVLNRLARCCAGSSLVTLA